MPVKYINYIGDNYYLHKGLSKKGNPRCWFSKSMEGELLEDIPEGFEIYENPNGLVFLRKIPLKIITDKEIDIVKRSIPKRLRYKIDVKKNTITIYLSDGGYNLYQAMMRFILIDNDTREFEAQRYCFRGSIDDWIELDSSNDLMKLAQKCCVHLGKDSFYDLPYLVDGF